MAYIIGYSRESRSRDLNCKDQVIVHARRSPLHANPIFTLSATPAPRRVIRKPFPLLKEGKRSPAMYAVYFRKHRRTDFLLLYPRLYYIATSCEHAPRRLSILCENHCCESGVLSSKVVCWPECQNVSLHLSASGAKTRREPMPVLREMVRSKRMCLGGSRFR
jgi:hypothetical protein